MYIQRKSRAKSYIDEESVRLLQHWMSDNECSTDDENMDHLVEKINAEKVIVRRKGVD